MTGCNAVCVQEEEGCELYKTAYVSADELLCRRVRPEDFKAKGELRASFIQTKSLRNGELSVWRLNQPSELSTLAGKLAVDANGGENILAARAGAIRTISLSHHVRALSVINDTRIDDQGNHDPQHAAIAPCIEILKAVDHIDEIMVELKTKLTLVFRNSGVALKPMPSPPANDTKQG